MSQQVFEVLRNTLPLIDANLSIDGQHGLELIPVFRSVLGNQHGGRTVVVAERVSDLSESSVNNYRLERSSHEKFNLSLSGTEKVVIDHLKVDLGFLRGGAADFELNVISFINVPLIGEGRGLTAEQKALVRQSNLMIVYLIFCENRGTCLLPAKNAYICESYNHFGFVLADEGLFNGFIIERLGAGQHNLVDVFTSTEIANEMFNDGLMALCWGITPWVYMITSHEGGLPLFFPMEVSPICSGDYIFSGVVGEVSVIPGTALINWDTENIGCWPRLQLVGEGNAIQLDLYVVRTVDENSGDFVPVPFFNFRRKFKSIDESKPILSCDIFDGN
ncbi:hypothetical protein WKR88_26305 [Trinickia caryophylli]|uniref:Uncharacterized protein n=1 Tax=Trinickia caryophylli TaxID=28094 RepID=A0A1X7HA65_TRICW|nr:hypothetical protein [Trinickia caryophylli]TRX15016.1 hypothetical protein FNF07_27830 [Trinickia caryophylli]WQE14872.1 hypothetical protein U0034_20155 [Trinickia caryophylli]GLU35766.1 hypothetical protein Busp01_56080 [Trinickia caryophylli]SMF82277.1 hypothetical protein SAMN06295900_12531 [Trinickia caryophylli]